QRGNVCFECGAQGHFKKECPKLKNNNNRGNQVGNAKAQEKVYAVGKAGANPDNNVVTAGSGSRPPILNKKNYVPWSSRLLRYTKSIPNGKLIHNSILNDDELSDKELKHIEADDQAIHTILLGLPEDIYAAVDSYETAQEIWLRVQQMMKGSNIGIQDKKAKKKHFPEKITSNLKFLNNLQPEWSRHVTIAYQTKDLHTADYTQLYDFLKYNQKEVNKLKAKLLAKTQDPLALMANSNNPYAFTAPHQDQSSFNQNYLQQPMPNPKDITDPTTAMNMALALMAKAFKLNYSTPTNNNQRILSNSRNRQIAQPKTDKCRWLEVMVEISLGSMQGKMQEIRLEACADGNAAGQNENQIRCYNCRGEEAGIQLQAEEYDLMAAAANLDEIKKVNANCILMANLQQASTSGTQTDSAPVYNSDGSAEVHEICNENCDGNEIFNMFTQEEQYTELLEPIPELHQVPQNDNDVISEDTSVEQGGEIVEQHPVNFEETHLNKQLSKEKSTVSFLLEEKKKLKSDFKIRKDDLLDKQIQLEKKIKELNNIMLKTGQSIQMIHMLSPKPDSFYHTEQKIALGYQNPFYLKKAQKKQQSLYDGKVLLKKHDPPVVHDSEETLQLAQKSHEKMKQMNKEIKPAKYTKINHLSRVFVPQMTLSREELYFSNNSKKADVSKSISIPNEDFSDDTTPSVARKFLNEVKSTIVTLQHVVKQRMTTKTHNWSSSAHQELHKIEATKFVGDFKSLANEADASLAELERTKERFKNCIIKKEIEYAKLWNDWYKSLGDLKGKTKDTSCVSDTRNPLSQKLKNKNVKLEFQVLNYARENAHLKATYKNMFDSISVSRAQTKTIIASLQNELQSNIYKNSKLRTQLFKKVSDQKDNTQDTSKNTKFAKQPIVENLPKVGKTNALSNPVTSNSVSLPPESKGVNNDKVIQICLWCIDSGCSKHMTGNLKLLINFIWKFMGTVRFGNDHVATILGFGDLLWGNILITRVYFVEGLGHNLFSVGQFCDSDLKVAFKRNACFVRNLEGVDLLKGDRSTNLYTINLHEMASASPICLMARDSSTKSWLWHQRLSHLNFDTINDLIRNDLVTGLPKFKYHKEHLCPSREQEKSKRASHPPKPVPNSRQRLHLLHMDLCGPMRIASINGKRYVLVIVDDYSHYTWSPIIIIRTDNDIEFKNQVLKQHFDTVGISHQMYSVRTPQQNGVVERRNRTLVEAARTMLIFSRAPLFLWAEAIATACLTQNRSIIHRRFNKTPYELINGRKPDISFLHVFGALCYPKNNREDIRKLGAKGDIGFFIGYSADSCAYRVYNRQTKKIMETMNVSFDELSAMDFEQHSSKPGLQSMTSGQISSGLDITYAPSTITTQQPSEGELDLLFEAMYDDYIGGQPSATARTVSPTPEHQVRQTSTASTTIANTAPIPTNSSSLATNILISSKDVDELNPNAMVVNNAKVIAPGMFRISPNKVSREAKKVPNTETKGKGFFQRNPNDISAKGLKAKECRNT
nr:retrovirus-related Pol polyprotein from transposon TNT 1-94 [Tanacetum cinerariifolium]